MYSSAESLQKGDQLIVENETRQIDISAPLEMEIIGELAFLKSHKFAGLEALSLTFFKDSNLSIRVNKTGGINLRQERGLD